MSDRKSALGRAYRIVYERPCGRHSRLYHWPSQWLGVHYLYRNLRRILPMLSSHFLDARCGEKPSRGCDPVTENVDLESHLPR
jgi:hypothetical protein